MRYATAFLDRRLVGETFGGYLIARMAGQGRFATCYEAYRVGDIDEQAPAACAPSPPDRADRGRSHARCLPFAALCGSPVALKLVKPRAGAVDFGAVWTECAALSMLEHPCVPQWLGIVNSPRACRGGRFRYFIVESYCRGSSLERMLASHVVFSDAAVASVGMRLIEAASHCWSRGVVHGDIRPANVLLAEDGALSLVDFGLARFFDRAAAPDDVLAFASPDLEGIAEVLLFMLYAGEKRVVRGRRGAAWQDELALSARQRSFLSDLFFDPRAFGSPGAVAKRFDAAFADER